MNSLRPNRDQVFSALRRSCEEVYGERLRTVAVFGSAGRDTARPDSDLDLLLVADPLPKGDLPRGLAVGCRDIWAMESARDPFPASSRFPPPIPRRLRAVGQ